MLNSGSRFVFLALLLVVAFVIPVLLHAQAVNGTILGIVQDQQGGAIGKAGISARNTETGAVRTTTSQDNGEYRITAVPAGSYEVTITATGFKTEVRSGISVTVGADVGVNFAMTVGAVTEKIEVTGEVAQVDTSGSAMGGFVNATTIRELPLNGRDWLQLALLQPGALTSSGVYQSDTSRAQRGNGLAISISGGRTTENVFRIDGLVVNDHANAGPGSSLHVNMGVDAIREFSVLTNNYSAEFGRGASGVINAITKSGTNEFHGSAYYFHRNSVLDARNFFDPKDIAPFRRHQYGGAIGGPIRKDKTFFFSNYEALTEAKGLSYSTDTLSANAHNGILCNSAPGNPCASTRQVPVDSRMKPYLQFYPFPNGQVTGDVGKFLLPAVRLGDEKFIIGKIDHYFSSNTTLNGHYSYDDTTVSSPDNYGQKLAGAPARKINGIVSLQHIFSPTLINNTRAGVTRTRAGNNLDCCIRPGFEALADTKLGFVPGNPTGYIAVSGIQSTTNWGGIGTAGLNDFHYTAPQLYNDVSWTKGRHSMRFGGGIERVLSNIDQRNRPNGLWTFGSIQSMLTVVPDQFSGLIPGSDTIRGARNSIIGAYFQDDYRIRPNLTINLGVRYDTTTVVKEVNGKIASLRNLTDPAVTVGDPYYNNPTFKNFAPRIGFAWDPFKDGKTAIRGGVGMFDIVPLPYLLVNHIQRTTPFYKEGTVFSPPSSSFPGQAFNLLSVRTLQATRVEPDPPRSYKMQWNFNVQRQVTRTIALTAGYVGSVGVKLAAMTYDFNQVPPNLVTFNGRNYVFPIPAGNNLSLIRRTNPNFGQIRSTDFRGHSSYHSLQVNFVQRPTKGLSYQVAYTYSKVIDNGSVTVGDNEYLNSIASSWSYCERCNRGPADYNIPHSLVFNFQYDLPMFAAVKSNKIGNTILSGWQIGGIWTRQSGGPYNVKITTDRAFTGSNAVGSTQGAQRSDYLGDLPGCSPAEVTTSDINHLIKTSCFAFPAPGILGNLGRNLFRMPVYRNVDFSVFKNQNLLGEKLRMQLRVEMFNIFNNTNLAAQTFGDSFTGTGALIGSFGTPRAPTTNQSRQIQLGLRLLF